MTITHTVLMYEHSFVNDTSRAVFAIMSHMSGEQIGIVELLTIGWIADQIVCRRLLRHLRLLARMNDRDPNDE